MDHAIKKELLVKDVIDWGFGEERIEYPHTLPRFSALSVDWPLNSEHQKGSRSFL